MIDRSNAYYERRLKDEHPLIHSDWQDGKYRSLAAATRAAGLSKERTRLHELKNAWKKATNDERQEFLKFLKSAGVDCRTISAGAGVPSAPGASSGSVAGLGFKVAVNGVLTQEAKDRIGHIMDGRKLGKAHGSHKTGVIMKELDPPFSPLNPALGIALHRGTRIAEEMIEALEKWMIDHEHL